jgi:antitoxin HicB
MTRYPVKITPDGPNYLATFRCFPGATFGANEAEALVRSRDALVTVLMTMIENRLPIPEPPPLKRGEYSISLPALVEAKVELYREMRAKNVRKSALARQLDWHAPQVDRLLDLRRNSRIDQIEKALLSLGKRLAVSLEDAPEGLNRHRSNRSLRGRLVRPEKRLPQL